MELLYILLVVVFIIYYLLRPTSKEEEDNFKSKNRKSIQKSTVNKTLNLLSRILK